MFVSEIVVSFMYSNLTLFRCFTVKPFKSETGATCKEILEIEQNEIIV